MLISCGTRRVWLRSVFAGTLAASMSRAGAEADAAEDPKKDKDEEEEIAVAKVPAKVRQAAAKAVGGAKWETAFRVKDEDGEFYELEGTDAKGRSVVVTISPEGEVDEIEVEIKLKDLPEAVAKAVKEKMPRFKPVAAFEVTEDGKVSRYEIEGRRPKDKEDISVSVSPDGKTIEINDGTDDKPQDKGDKAKPEVEDKGDKPKAAAKGKKAKP